MGCMRVLKRPWNWAYLEFAVIAIVFAVILVLLCQFLNSTSLSLSIHFK